MFDLIAGWLIRLLRWLLTAVEVPDIPAGLLPPAPCGCLALAALPASPPLPAHRSPYAAESAAEAEADRVGAVRRWPPPSPRPYVTIRWHHEGVRRAQPVPPTAPASAAQRLTEGRRRAELRLSTRAIDAGRLRTHGVPVGGAAR